MSSIASPSVRHSDLVLRRQRAGDVAPTELPSLAPDSDEHSWSRTVVAELDGEIIGVATTRLSPVTLSYFCEVHVASAHRRAGVGTELYRFACSLLEHQHPVLTRAMASQPVRRQFAEAIGCTVLVHHPEPWADPQADAWTEWIRRHPVPQGYTAITLAEADPAVAERAWAQSYEWLHALFGPVKADRLPESWQRYRAGQDEDASRLLVRAEDHHDPVALSLVTSGTWQGRRMLVSQTVREDQPDGATLVAAAVASTLHHLGGTGVRLVELEGPDADPHLASLHADLPPHQADPMDLLRLRRL